MAPSYLQTHHFSNGNEIVYCPPRSWKLWNPLFVFKAGMQGSNPQLEFSLTASFELEGLKKALMLNRRSHDQLADWNGSISKLELIKL